MFRVVFVCHSGYYAKTYINLIRIELGSYPGLVTVRTFKYFKRLKKMNSAVKPKTRLIF